MLGTKITEDVMIRTRAAIRRMPPIVYLYLATLVGMMALISTHLAA